MKANFFKTDDNEQLYYAVNFDEVPEDRPVLIFNYGLVCSGHHWSYQTNYFQQNYPILIHDYRGHFQSTGKDSIEKINFPQMSKDLKALCDHLGIKKAVLLGHSMGVNICLQIAKDFPELVMAQVLISGTVMPVTDIMFDTNLMEFIAPFGELALRKYPDVIEKIWKSSGQNPLIKKMIHHQGFKVENVSKEFIEVYLNKVGVLGPEIFFQLFNEMTRQNILGDLSKMHHPALIMGGMRDKVIPNHLQHLLHSMMPDSETYFYKDGSHVPQVDYPDLTNERIELFLKQKVSPQL
jgi:non-heme chloroperoxidase